VINVGKLLDIEEPEQRPKRPPSIRSPPPPRLKNPFLDFEPLPKETDEKMVVLKNKIYDNGYFGDVWSGNFALFLLNFCSILQNIIL